MMDEAKCDELLKELTKLIEVTSYYDHNSMDDIKMWLEQYTENTGLNCWKTMGCENEECAGRRAPKGRCWLVVGSMADRSCPMSKKFKTCTKCEDVFGAHVFKDKYTTIREYIYILVQGLMLKQDTLKKAIERAIKEEMDVLKRF